MKTLIYFAIALLLLPAFSACIDDDDFSSDKNLSLVFSTDTISFDTIFTNVGSATQKFKIYNRNDKSLRIESIELLHATETGFRMNIDGEKGTKLTDVEILKKDSLYGFVEVTVDPQKSPLLVRDSIRFVVNGNTQYIQLAAIGKDVYIWRDKVIEENTVVIGDKPFLVYGTLTINENAILTIEKGTTFYMYNNASVDVHGTVKAQGSVEAPVVFRGSRFDYIERDIPYDNVSGQWTGMIFRGESYNNVFENLTVRNATRAVTFEEADPQYKKATLKNVTVQNSSEYGLQAVNCNIDVQNGLFNNAKGAVLALYGGEYSFLHCTVANYYNWAARESSGLILGNYSDKGVAYPLNKCDFVNSIVYGSVTREIQLNQGGTIPFEFIFRNCLLKAPEVTDGSLVNIIWNADPLFKNLDTENIHSYNFELTQNSPARDKADKSYSSLVPEDIKGVSRMDNPDLGCYEWVK